MKLLIVSSEPLSPADTLPSIFELAQARLLARRHEVAILSVGQSPGRRERVKSVLRSPLSVFASRKVRRHVIDGVPVYEGLATAGKAGFHGQLDAWTGAGKAALAAYREDHGKPDVIHAHGRFLNAGALALQVRGETGVPYVYTDHSTFYRRGLAAPEAAPVLAEVINGAAAYTTVSAALARDIDQFLGGGGRQAVITPNLLDERFEQAPPCAAPPRPFVFVSVGALDEKKGFDLLIRAFAMSFGGSPDHEVHICGEGPQRASLENLARQLGVASQVRFFGKLSSDQVLSQLDGAHVVVVPSRVETFGVVVIEALARGRPVVATRCGGPEEIVDAASGLIIPPGDVDALSDALTAMAASRDRYDPATIRRRAIDTYGARAFLERMSGVYQAALA